MRCPAWGTSFFCPRPATKTAENVAEYGKLACPATKTPENVDEAGEMTCPATKTPENVDEGCYWISSSLKRSSTKAFLSKTLRSSMPSPIPTNFMGKL